MASHPSAFTQASTQEVALSRGLTVTIQARDFMTLFLEGVFEVPLLSAFDRLMKQAPVFIGDPTKILTLSAQDRKAIVDGLRSFAIAICTEPIFVPVADGNPDHVVITVLSSNDLLAIWTAGNSLMGLAPGVTPETADRFRGTEPAPVNPDPPSGEDVRTETEPVVHLADGEFIYR